MQSDQECATGHCVLKTLKYIQFRYTQWSYFLIYGFLRRIENKAGIEDVSQIIFSHVYPFLTNYITYQNIIKDNNSTFSINTNNQFGQQVKILTDPIQTYFEGHNKHHKTYYFNGVQTRNLEHSYHFHFSIGLIQLPKDSNIKDLHKYQSTFDNSISLGKDSDYGFLLLQVCPTKDSVDSVVSVKLLLKDYADYTPKNQICDVLSISGENFEITGSALSMTISKIDDLHTIRFNSFSQDIKRIFTVNSNTYDYYPVFSGIECNCVPTQRLWFLQNSSPTFFFEHLLDLI